MPACVSADKYMRLEHEYATLQDQLLFTQDQLSSAEAALADGTMSQEEFDRLEAELLALQQEKAELDAKWGAFESRKSGLAQAGFETYDAGGGLVGFRGASDVFFASGQDALTSEGKRALDALVATELGRSNGAIQVVGHTDTDPINKTKAKYPKGNIQLGVMRALSVQEYLVTKGVDASRISIASWGEHQPLAKGNGKDAKARNRRVEILVPVSG